MPDEFPEVLYVDPASDPYFDAVRPEDMSDHFDIGDDIGEYRLVRTGEVISTGVKFEPDKADGK